MRQHGERFGFAVFVFEFGEIRFPRLTLAEEEDGGFGKGPAQMDVADLFARRAQPFAIGFFGALDQTTIRDEILHAGKAGDVLNLIQNDQAPESARSRGRIVTGRMSARHALWRCG